MTVGWTAGIVDGEGSIAISQGDSVISPGQVRFSVVNTDRRILEQLRLLWGGSIKEKPRYSNNRRQPYEWRLINKDLPKFLARIIPHLISKREQALLALEYQKLVIPDARGRRLTNEAAVKREEIRVKVSNLNRGEQCE